SRHPPFSQPFIPSFSLYPSLTPNFYSQSLPSQIEFSFRAVFFDGMMSQWELQTVKDLFLEWMYEFASGDDVRHPISFIMLRYRGKITDGGARIRGNIAEEILMWQNIIMAMHLQMSNALKTRVVNRYRKLIACLAMCRDQDRLMLLQTLFNH